jgi:DNA-binding NtrC family response regulator
MKRSIFYLDDEAVCLEVFQELFGKDYDIRTATTVSEARLMLAQRPSDIIISDQCMPDISGTKFLSEIAAVYPASYRVLLTGSINIAGALPEIGKGIIHHFIAKPWQESDMSSVLERANLAT